MTIKSKGVLARLAKSASRSRAPHRKTGPKPTLCKCGNQRPRSGQPCSVCYPERHIEWRERRKLYFRERRRSMIQQDQKSRIAAGDSMKGITSNGIGSEQATAPAASITVHVPQARAWRITPVKRDVYGNEVTDSGSSSVRLIPQSELTARETIGTRAEG
jgi:hypothetical protein